MSESGERGVGRPAVQHTVSGFTAACVLVSNIIGSGIFTTTGFLARDLGDAGTILSLWLIGALLALAGAMSYSELGAALPQVGGDYVYLRQAYGPILGFLSGWVSFTVGFGAAIAAAAVSFASYLLRITLGHEPSLLVKVLALWLVWTLTGVHLAGVGPGGQVQRVLTVTKIGTILALVVGAVLFGTGTWEHLMAEGRGARPTIGTTVVALVFVMYAYSGWNVAGYIAGEIADPARAIPRIMIGGTLFVGAVYLALNLVYFYALPVASLAEAPLLQVVEKAAMALFGPAGAGVIVVMLCASIAAAASAMIWAGPRVYYAMAQDGLFPSFFAELRMKGGAPARAILLQSGWATVLILSGTFEQLVVYSGLVLTTFSALAVGAVIVLRRRRPDLIRPYQVPLYPVPPCLYVAASLLIVGYTLIERPAESAWAGATVLAGVPLYLFQRSVGKRAQAFTHRPFTN
jgi:APA family basic amino acid/polyamine antiporter